MLTLKKKLGTPSNKFFFYPYNHCWSFSTTVRCWQTMSLHLHFFFFFFLSLFLSFFLFFCIFAVFAFLLFLKSLLFFARLLMVKMNFFIFSIMVFHKSVNAWLSKCKVSTLSTFICTRWLAVNHLLGPCISIYYLINFLWGFN